MLTGRSSPSHQICTCSYVLKKKRRRCRMQVLIGENFCGEHIVHSLSGEKAMTSLGEGRVQCPLDPSHTCFANRLVSHLNRCNARVPPVTPPYYRENINAGTVSSRQGVTDGWGPPLRSLSDSHLIELLSRIDMAYEKHAASVTEMFADHPVLESSLQCPDFGADTIKHLRQNSSLIGILDRYQLLNGESTYVELGSGKARLSYWLARALPGSARVLLVDRASHRHKAENRLKDISGAPRVDRLKIDIRHLALTGHEACCGRPLVVLGKHLCGAASDLAIRAVTAGPPGIPPDDTTSAGGIQLAGMLVALCCHHRVDFDSYVGSSFLQEQCGISVSDFNCLRGIAAWATCGTADWTDSDTLRDQSTSIASSVNSAAVNNVATPTSLTTPTTDISTGVSSTAAVDLSTPTTDISTGVSSTAADDLSTPTTDISTGVNSTAVDNLTTTTHLTTPTADVPTSTNPTAAPTSADSVELGVCRYRRMGLAPSRRTELGMKCKRLLDTGRLHYLMERGVRARLVRYVPESVSPENVALLAAVQSD